MWKYKCRVQTSATVEVRNTAQMLMWYRKRLDNFLSFLNFLILGMILSRGHACKSIIIQLIKWGRVLKSVGKFREAALEG